MPDPVCLLPSGHSWPGQCEIIVNSGWTGLSPEAQGKVQGLTDSLRRDPLQGHQHPPPLYFLLISLLLCSSFVIFKPINKFFRSRDSQPCLTNCISIHLVNFLPFSLFPLPSPLPLSLLLPLEQPTPSGRQLRAPGSLSPMLTLPAGPAHQHHPFPLLGVVLVCVCVGGVSGIWVSSFRAWGC